MPLCGNENKVTNTTLKSQILKEIFKVPRVREEGKNSHLGMRIDV